MLKDVIAWEEHIISHDKGNRVIHFYLKFSSGDLILAVVGTEKSIRHMTYVVSDEFLEAYGSIVAVNSCTKWRARREVVDWLNRLVSKRRSRSKIPNSRKCDSTLESTMPRLTDHHSSYNMVNMKLEPQHSNVLWLGDAWICCKLLKHYPAFCRDGVTIAVHSFAMILADEGTHYLGYLEDLFEDQKQEKQVKVRWFQLSKEVNRAIPDAAPHPKEVFISPLFQVISVECIDGPATILTPKHYERSLATVSQVLSSDIFFCSKQLINNEVKDFSLTTLGGYSRQPIVSSLDRSLSSKSKLRKEPIGINPVINEPWGWVCSLKIGDKIELLCQDSGIRGCWFRCKVLQVSRKCLKVQYEDVKDAEGPGNLEEWVPSCRIAAPDKLGMRYPGRLTFRPRPPEDSSSGIFELGSAVDVWWCDGWWEGVLAEVNISGNDGLCVYLPGEERLLTLHKEKLRSSRDWVGNRWVRTKAKPDVLSSISLGASLKTKFQTCSVSAKTSKCSVESVALTHQVVASPHEAVEEWRHEMPVSVPSIGMEMEKEVLNSLNDQLNFNDDESDDPAD